MATTGWWESESEQRDWMEITDRSDLGADLHAPQFGLDGQRVWHYETVSQTKPGDVVFHWHRTPAGRPAIVGWSIVTGALQVRPYKWEPHILRGRTPPTEVGPNWYTALEGFHALAIPVTLDELRRRHSQVLGLQAELRVKYRGFKYFPFVKNKNEGLRAFQGYLVKFPAELISVFESFGSLEVPTGSESRTAVEPTLKEALALARTWRDEVRALVRSMPNEFRLTDVYAASGPLAERHPANDRIEDTIRRVLQELRNDGEVGFVDNNGSYRRLKNLRDPFPEALQSRAVGSTPVNASPGEPDAVPLERRLTESYEVGPQEATQALQREYQLVEAFRTHLRGLGHEVGRWRIPIGRGRNLYTDLRDVTRNILYEAKASTDRNSLRLAIGQLLDYRRFVQPAEARVLLPSKPEATMLELILSLGLGATWRTREGFEGT